MVEPFPSVVWINKFKSWCRTRLCTSSYRYIHGYVCWSVLRWLWQRILFEGVQTFGLCEWAWRWDSGERWGLGLEWSGVVYAKLWNLHKVAVWGGRQRSEGPTTQAVWTVLSLVFHSWMRILSGNIRDTEHTIPMSDSSTHLDTMIWIGQPIKAGPKPSLRYAIDYSGYKLSSCSPQPQKIMAWAI